jgi:hypothetical protein
MAVDVAALKAAHPEWNIVDAVEADGGGVWALGADGGVFALGGAPFLGSYAGESAQVRNDPTRRFTLIQRDPVTGGYKLLTDRPWESYNYGAPAGPAAGAPGGDKPGPADPGAPAPGPDSDESRVNAMMTSLGLGELGAKAYAYWKSLGGSASMEDLNIWLQGQPEYETRFPGMKYLADQGLAWTPAQYITYERAIRQNLVGLPDSFFDSHDDFGEFIKKGWSPDEIGQAVTQARDAVLTMPPETRAALSRWENQNGTILTDGELAALWIDPDVALPIVEARAKAAATAGAATRVGFTSTFGDELTEAEATRLTQAGAGAEALAGVTRLAPLFSETAEETTDFGRAEALGAAAGEGPAEEALRRRRASRVARFEGGGGAAGVGGPRSGLGTAQ